MKKFSKVFIIGAIILTIEGCFSFNTFASTTDAYYASTDEVTLEKIEEMSVPAKMLEYKGGVEIKYGYHGTGNENLESGTSIVKFLKEGNIIHSNQLADYPDGSFTHLYFSNDENDPYLYMQSNGGTDKSPLTSEEIEATFNESLYWFGGSDAKLVSVSEEDNTYVAVAELYYEGSKESEINITLDPETGYVLESETIYYMNGKETSRQSMCISYSSDVSIDYSPKDAAEDIVTSENNTVADKLSFSTVDINGNTVTDEIIKDAKVVMVNYWEPWCGPCVAEMPDLEKLYEKYKDQGLLVLGVFSSTDMDDDAKAILEDCGITYPVVRCDSNLKNFITDYFPTTIFADAEGNILSEEPILGANSYSDWENLIETYLK